MGGVAWLIFLVVFDLVVAVVCGDLCVITFRVCLLVIVFFFGFGLAVTGLGIDLHCLC